jgi:hypothetical protein
MFKLKIWSSSPNSRKDSSYAIIKYIEKDTTNYNDFVDEFAEDRAEILGRQWTFTKKLDNFTHIVDILEKTCTCRVATKWKALPSCNCFHNIT